MNDVRFFKIIARQRNFAGFRELVRIGVDDDARNGRYFPINAGEKAFFAGYELKHRMMGGSDCSNGNRIFHSVFADGFRKNADFILVKLFGGMKLDSDKSVRYRPF